MKKLSLKKLNLNVSDLLKKEQLKSVFGGYGGGHGCSGPLVPCQSYHIECCCPSGVAHCVWTIGHCLDLCG